MRPDKLPCSAPIAFGSLDDITWRSLWRKRGKWRCRGCGRGGGFWGTNRDLSIHSPVFLLPGRRVHLEETCKAKEMRSQSSGH
jgi:hypothetical protein